MINTPTPTIENAPEDTAMQYLRRQTWKAIKQVLAAGRDVMATGLGTAAGATGIVVAETARGTTNGLRRLIPGSGSSSQVAPQGI